MATELGMFSVTHEREPIRLQDFLPCPLRPKMTNDISLVSRFLDNERGSVGTKDHFL